MNAPRTLDDRIALVERKLELRRQRMDRHLHEMRGSVLRATAWWPLAAAAGALGVGFAFARRPAGATSARKAGLLATLAAVAGSVLRFALSPGARALWTSLRSAGSAR